VRWLVDNSDRSNGKDLKIYTQHLSWNEATNSLTDLMVKNAMYNKTLLDKYFRLWMFPHSCDRLGHSAVSNFASRLKDGIWLSS